jgi:hypothetical protein
MGSTVAEETIKAQYDRFLVALPSLLHDHRGEWVVWFDGEALAFHPDEDAAETWAFGHLSPDAGFVIAPVAEPRPIALSGLAMFRLTP